MNYLITESQNSKIVRRLGLIDKLVKKALTKDESPYNFRDFCNYFTIEQYVDHIHDYVVDNFFESNEEFSHDPSSYEEMEEVVDNISNYMSQHYDEKIINVYSRHCINK